MKKTLLIAAILFSISLKAQEKKDTVPMVHIVVTVEQYKQLLYSIDSNIDSKKAAKDIVDFLQKSAQLVQPAEKPKEDVKPKPKQ